MPRKRQPNAIWRSTRLQILKRDEYRCVRCNQAVTIQTAHIDHIVSGKLGSNRNANLRVLCRTCHVLRADHRHRGMTAKALKDNIIPPHWRELTWEG